MRYVTSGFDCFSIHFRFQTLMPSYSKSYFRTTHFLPTFVLLALLMSSCSRNDAARSTASLRNQGAWIEPKASRSFLENLRELQSNDGFRRNVHLCANGNGIGAAICMDLKHRLHLVVRAQASRMFPEDLPVRFKHLMVPVNELRAQMDPGAFILKPGDNLEALLCFRIPGDAPESFPTDVLNPLLRMKLARKDLFYAWD